VTNIGVAIRRLANGEGLDLPDYATELSAGADLLAAVDGPLELLPGSHAMIPTGIAIALPPGYEAQVRPRSGLALKHAVTVLNAPGTIDADYRGEIGVILINHGKQPFIVERAMRIAQMIIAPVVAAIWQPTASLPDSARAGGGFGSTGGMEG